ncbi:hypothetical protein [Bacillus massiliigorillae]|uniref:hypothetical protein n=1 Tax=Bacillus massiliigorillae TaxID=1243664 RepID=UPI00039B8042|nr:hypothetical protein [Bacillus massiliigorillae]
MEVIGKCRSDDYKEYWIIAYDFNNQQKEEAFKILVQEEMVWNLIEEGKEYFAVYAKKDNESWFLQQIEHIDSDKNL